MRRYRSIKYRSKRSDAVFRAIYWAYIHSYSFTVIFDDWLARNLIP